jgi:hypothetical protein
MRADREQRQLQALLLKLPRGAARKGALLASLTCCNARSNTCALCNPRTRMSLIVNSYPSCQPRECSHAQARSGFNRALVLRHTQPKAPLTWNLALLGQGQVWSYVSRQQFRASACRCCHHLTHIAHRMLWLAVA